MTGQSGIERAIELGPLKATSVPMTFSQKET